MNQIYTVKEAARILGFSTNTVYKYLNEGRLKAARGDIEQGRFRIPHQAIEEFLGTQIPADILDHLRHDGAAEPTTTTSTPTTAVTPLPPPTLPMSAARILILCALIAIIIDIITAPSISLLGQITRIGVVGIFILLAYQQYRPTPTHIHESYEPINQPPTILDQQQ